LLALIAMGAVGFLPLFGGFGYESALAAGVIVPSVCAASVALHLLGKGASLRAAFEEGILSGLYFCAVVVVVGFAHGLRSGFCDLTFGLIWFGLTALPGIVLAGAWGAIVSVLAQRLQRKRLWAFGLAVGLPIASIGVSLWRFYSSPMIFAYDPFFGYFSGTLYDTVIEPTLPLVTYRVGTLCTLFAVGFAIFTWEARDALKRQPLGAVVALVFAMASIGVTLASNRLGHSSTRASIEEALGGRTEGARCTVIHPASIRREEAELLVRDCEEELRSVEKAYGVRWEGPLTAIFFRDAAEKRRLMGAEHTYIAKPWRREVYLQMAAYPHPVLGHEIAHVVAGQFARGPFRIAGAMGGVLPNPGLIEGLAVYASPEEDSLSLSESSKAMIDLGSMQPMKSLFSLAFLGESSQKSYTLAGAFVSWVKATFGIEIVRRWYAGEEIEVLTSKSWGDLDGAFRASVARVALSDEALAVAKGRFERASIWRRNCPHVVDGLRAEGDRCAANHEVDKAIDAYQKALALDPFDPNVKFSRADLDRRYRDRERGTAAILGIAADTSVPPGIRRRAEEALADSEMRDGKFEAAAERYRHLLEKIIDEDAARAIEVKEIAARSPEDREATMALLIGGETRGVDMFRAGVALGQAASTPLTDYLIGRNLILKNGCEAGEAYLNRAIEKGLPTVRLMREAWKQKGICACSSRNLRAVEEVKTHLTDPQGPFAAAPEGRRASLGKMLERCAN